MEEVHRASFGERAGNFHVLSRCHSPPNLHVVHSDFNDKHSVFFPNYRPFSLLAILLRFYKIFVSCLVNQKSRLLRSKFCTRMLYQSILSQRVERFRVNMKIFYRSD